MNKKLVKKLIIIVVAVCAIITAFAMGYIRGAIGAMESAYIIEDSKYHYAIGFFEQECEYYYSK